MKTKESVREPAVAGSFYPKQSQELESDLQTMLDGVNETKPLIEPPHALIVPHAGYIYSGPVAASAYATLRPFKDKIERVILIGPSHTVAFPGIAVPNARFWKTPLGELKIDHDVCNGLNNQIDAVIESDIPHLQEHSLEVQLPFLQTCLNHFELIPLLIGDSNGIELAAALEASLAPGTLIVVSSDLSHYLDYKSAQEIDLKTTRSISSLDPHSLEFEQACGRVPMQGLIHLARQKGWRPRLIDLRNSGDTAGDRDRVVGYCSYVFT